MLKSKENKVFTLISTLNKAEKRYFRLFVNRNQENSNPLFLKLFEVYDQYGNVQDDFIVQKIPQIKQAQLSNLRNHLYKQLLTSLRLQGYKNNTDVVIRQEIDFAKVLYNKGLYRQSLSILTKAKRMALENNHNVLGLEIHFFEKAIESQNITKSIGSKATDLVNESEEIYENIESILRYSNLDLQLYAYYLKHGFCESEEDRELVEDLFSTPLVFDERENNFYALLYWLQSKCWYYYIRQDFYMYLKSATDLLELFAKNPKMKVLRPSLYLKGIHNAIAGAFINYDLESFKRYKKQLDEVDMNPADATWNDLGHYQLYQQMHELDSHFLLGDFNEYLPKKAALMQLLEENPYHWDLHRLLIFQYKLACIHFGIEDYSSAIDHFNYVIQHSSKNTRVVIFSRLLQAFSHLQMGNNQLVLSLLPALQKEFQKEKKNTLEKQLFELVQELSVQPKENHFQVYERHLQIIEELEAQPFSKISFLHFYAKEWIQAMIEKKQPQELIARKALFLGTQSM